MKNFIPQIRMLSTENCLLYISPQMSRWYLNAEWYHKTDEHWFKCCYLTDPAINHNLISQESTRLGNSMIRIYSWTNSASELSFSQLPQYWGSNWSLHQNHLDGCSTHRRASTWLGLGWEARIWISNQFMLMLTLTDVDTEAAGKLASHLKSSVLRQTGSLHIQDPLLRTSIKEMPKEEVGILSK